MPVDGTGARKRMSDVAIDGKTISAVAPRLGTGKREINADGLLLTPGWVDIHTHYDGQATWDPYLTPSSRHGVTTAVFGNCGVDYICDAGSATSMLTHWVRDRKRGPGLPLEYLVGVKRARVELNSAFGISEASHYNFESLFCVSL